MKNKPYTDKMYRPEVQGPKNPVRPSMPTTKPKPIPGFIMPSPVGSRRPSEGLSDAAKKAALEMIRKRRNG